MRRRAILLALGTLSMPLAAQEAPQAQRPQEMAKAEVPEPPPIPDLSSPEGKLGDARKYVVFHKADTTYEAALSDVKECAAHSGRLVQRKANTFVPWGRDDAGNAVAYDGGQFGLVGFAIASIIDGPIERSIRQSSMIRCMTPRGYVRYRANKDQWQELFETGENGSELLAAIAAGPVPPTPEAKP
ncbi:hypothetical protein [Erythrobacter crassostreae]|uniref:Uncharacterized protein n=1 Tax=Erythrobacter crassostreae TaxID=2828328 RepID=A0A9X1F4A5_9SPHN|nr:hypothetical protein [Erythrobacter crassostrea]MBV7259228.1 hypothetical protein [Erythrobacter crassostrea]